MHKFIPCDLAGQSKERKAASDDLHDPKCYRCAVEAVILALGFLSDCECLAEGKKRCGKSACGTLSADWVRALDAVKPPHLPLVDDYVGTLGVKLEKVCVDSEDVHFDTPAPHELDELKFSTDTPVAIFFAQDVDQAARELAETVFSDPISHDAAKRLVARALRKGSMPPVALQGWLIDLLEGRITRPKATAKMAGTTRDRDRLIVELVEGLVLDRGLPATSGNADRGHAACNAVAQAFQHLGIRGMGYETVVKAWKSRRHLNTVEFPPRR